jgi:hypothetical protein
MKIVFSGLLSFFEVVVAAKRYAQESINGACFCFLESALLSGFMLIGEDITSRSSVEICGVGSKLATKQLKDKYTNVCGSVIGAEKYSAINGVKFCGFCFKNFFCLGLL